MNSLCLSVCNHVGIRGETAIVVENGLSDPSSKQYEKIIDYKDSDISLLTITPKPQIPQSEPSVSPFQTASPF